MAVRQETDIGGPPSKVFVVAREGQLERLEYFDEHCRSLYGSAVRVDSGGTIYYPTWEQVGREEVEPSTYALLSKERVRVSDEVYLSWRLVTKELYRVLIKQVTKDGGTVEVAIRAMEHVIEGELKKEQPQMRMVRGRVAELFDLFADFSAVTEEQFEQAERETQRRLAAVGFNPQTVVLEEKQQIGRWLPKASGGKDSLGRRNWLITMMALTAAHTRAVEREQGIGGGVTKFVGMRKDLCFERAFCRDILAEVVDRLAPERLPAHYLFKFPEKPPQNLGVVKGILNTMSWQLSLPRVKPYRPVGRDAREVLLEVIDLLGQDRRVEIMEADFFGQVRGILGEVLESHKVS